MRWVWVRVLDASVLTAPAATLGPPTSTLTIATPAHAAAAVASTQGRQLVVLCLHKA